MLVSSLSPQEVTMDEAIAAIIEDIPQGVAFDAHYVIDTLIHDHSDDYLRFASTITAQTHFTPFMHSEIAKRIDRLDGTVLVRQPHKSYSYNIRWNASECTLWIKR
jgi:hypothetical protein